MDTAVKNSIYEVMDTIGEALLHLQQTEDEEVRQMVVLGRRRVTSALEEELGGKGSLNRRMDADSLSDEDWLRAVSIIMEQIEEPFQPKNIYDGEFLSLLDYIWKHSKEELMVGMLQQIITMRKQSEESYQGFVTYFSRFPLWGTLDPEQNDYQTLEMRVDVLKRHSFDFLWLYCRLEDYLSKRTLCAILMNWAVLDTEYLARVKSIFSDYWEPDIFPDNKDDVLVDVGAYTGDSIEQYIQAYGMDYRKIYAYEITRENCEKLCKNTASIRDVILRRKGAGAVRGEMFLAVNLDSSANQLRVDGEDSERVEVVPLDEDIEDPVTFIKMDIEGAEQEALLGCQNIIRTQRPKLAICTYHGYEDIWKIPLMIDAMNPDYHFYLRHYGGNLIPTEFVLLCKPKG